jgi:predicted  nucleic acid-binding Zn-ribbon protein
MTALELQIKAIQNKLQQLLTRHDDAQKENIRLKKELDSVSKQNAQYQQTIDALKQQVEVLKLSSGDWDENDKKQFEKRLNHYIREIDKCIALLNG